MIAPIVAHLVIGAALIDWAFHGFKVGDNRADRSLFLRTALLADFLGGFASRLINQKIVSLGAGLDRSC
jgi:hypothetical protein